MPKTGTLRPWILALACVAGAIGTTRGADDVKVVAVMVEPKVKVVVLSILATDQNSDVDPELKCIAEKVRKNEPGLTGFRLARTSTQSLDIGKATKVSLADGKSMTVTVDQGPDEKNKVSLTVKPPELGEICYTSCCGKYFPIVTSCQTKEKERLIIAIMVDPCKKKCD